VKNEGRIPTVAEEKRDCERFLSINSYTGRTGRSHSLDLPCACSCKCGKDEPTMPEGGCTQLDEVPFKVPDVPFKVQEWMFESLVVDKTVEVCDMLDDVTLRSIVIETARERFKKGYAQYGSTMYGWTPEERLRNVVEELADAIVYLTSGPTP